MASRSKRNTAGAVCPWDKLTDSGRGLHIEDFLTFHLIRLANAAKTNVTRRYLIEFNLSVPEWRLLALTIGLSPVRFSELVARSHMDKGQVSRTLQTMTQRGLISAKTVSAASRRSKEAISAPVIVAVTPKGRKLYDAVLPVARRNQARLLNTLSPSERKTLHSVLTKLFETVGAEKT